MLRRQLLRLSAARVVLIGATALVALTLPSTVLANGKPIQIVLSYLPNISNTGTTSASGIAELVLAEGEARVSATGLPRLDPPQLYTAWVVNTTTNEFQAVGRFNTAYTTGAATLDNVLPQAIPDKGWNLFLITIEDSTDPTRPSEKHSIGGFFPPAGTEPRPNLLPNTGGPVAAQAVAAQNRPDWTVVAGLAALTLVAGIAAGYVLGRRRPASR